MGGSRRRARAGRRRRRCRSVHSSLFGGTLFVSHNALRRRPGWGEEGKWAGGEVGGAGRARGRGTELLRKRRRVARGCPELNCWGVCLLIHRGFRHCLHLCVCAHVQIYIHMLHKLCPTCPSSSCPLSQVPACTEISISGHGLCFWNFFFLERKAKETSLFFRMVSVAVLKPEHRSPFLSVRAVGW